MVWPNEACKALQGGKESELDRISDEPHPYVNLKDLQRELLQYKRADGVGLTAELFTPPGYDAERDGRLPCVLWAYPRCGPLQSSLHSTPSGLFAAVLCVGVGMQALCSELADAQASNPPSSLVCPA